MLDLFQQDAAVSLAPRPEERPSLPVGFGEAFGAALSEQRLFGQSIAGQNSRMAALGDFLDEVHARTGQRLAVGPQPGEDGTLVFDGWGQANEELRKAKDRDPSFPFGPLSDEEIEQRAISKSRAARERSAEIGAREQTLGGRIGGALGTAAGAATDPINILALPVAPAAEIGYLATALRWGAIGGGSQLGIELAGGAYRQQVQPDYGTSAEPWTNIGEAALGAGVLGVGFKGLGALWTRFKGGTWPRSVRDAGNVVESEANVASTNVLPGVAGEVAHRQALTKAMDDVVAGRPVDVDSIVDRTPPPVSLRRVEPRNPGDHSYDVVDSEGKTLAILDVQPKGDRLEVGWIGGEDGAEASLGSAKVRAVLRQLADQYPDAKTIGGIRVGGARGGIMEDVQAPLIRARDDAITARDAAKAARAEAREAGQLPFEPTAKEVVAERHLSELAGYVQDLARISGHEMERGEAEALAKRVTAASESEAVQILSEIALRPRTVADTLPSAAAAKTERNMLAKMVADNEAEIAMRGRGGTETLDALAKEHTREAIEKLRAEPELDETMLRDLDRLRAENGNIDVPMGETVDANGNKVTVTRKIDDVIAEADAREAAAREIEACVGPQPEPKE